MTKGKPRNSPRCCGCNGQNAVCKGCKCAKASTYCTDCAATNCINRGNSTIIVDHSTSCSTSSHVTTVNEPANSIAPIQEDVRTINHVFSNPRPTAASRDLLNDRPSAERMPCSYEDSINFMYNKVILWKPNLLSLPICQASNRFIDLLASRYLDVGEGTANEGIALKEVTVICQLILQRIPSRKAAVIRKTLERRTQMWADKQIHDLFEEAFALQQKVVQGLTKSVRITNQNESGVFSRLMQSGKTHAAIRTLDSQYASLPLLKPDDKIDGVTIYDILLDLHPPGKPIHKDSILNVPLPGCMPHHAVVFSAIDGQIILEAAMRTHGCAGPSGVDAVAFKRMISSFGPHSRKLADAIASFAIRIASERVDPFILDAFTVSRLVALDKNPGVRPIGIGEIVRRIVGKVIMSLIGKDLQAVSGHVQMCSGQRGGMEYIIHRVSETITVNDQYVLLSVDAKNAFNTANRKVVLANVPFICPALECILHNTYSEPSKLVCCGRSLRSQEGFTQGDPLAMAAFAVSSLAIIHRIRESVPHVSQYWYADDANFMGSLEDVARVWDLLESFGHQHGYFVNANKSIVMIHSEQLKETEKRFEKYNVRIETRGVKLLGSPVGDAEFVKNMSGELISKWSCLIRKLANAAKHDAQSAYVAFVKACQSKWLHLCRTTQCDPGWFSEIRQLIFGQFAFDVFGHTLDETEQLICSLPLSFGGMGFRDPCVDAPYVLNASKRLCRAFDQSDNILEVDRLQTQALKDIASDNRLRSASLLVGLRERASIQTVKLLQYASIKGASSWLQTSPLKASGFNMTKFEFQDAVAARYNWSLSSLPKKCECGDDICLTHALSCKRGALPIIRHNEVRDVLASALSEICNGVGIEPALQPVTNDFVFQCSTTARGEDAHPDIVCGGLFGGRLERTFIDVCVFNNLAPSYHLRTVDASFEYHENRKRAKYQERISEIEHSSFIPFVLTATGGFGPTAKRLMQTIAARMSSKLQRSYSDMISLIRTRFSITLARSISRCMRAPRSRIGEFTRPMGNAVTGIASIG